MFEVSSKSNEGSNSGLSSFVEWNTLFCPPYAGLKTVLKLRSAKLDELSRILGKATAEKVKEQVGKKVIRES